MLPKRCLGGILPLEEWGASILDEEACGVWSPLEQQEHIIHLQLRAICPGFKAFEDVLQARTMAVLSDNFTAASYIKKAGGKQSAELNRKAQLTLQWAKVNPVTLLTQFVRGENNVVVDCLSRRKQVISMEWVLHQQMCNNLWQLWDCPMVDLFATRMNYRLANFTSHHFPTQWR